MRAVLEGSGLFGVVVVVTRQHARKKDTGNQAPAVQPKLL